MAGSQHRAIRTAIAALFTAEPGALAAGNVHENRDYALAEGVTEQIHVNRVVSLPEAIQITGAPVDWTSEIEIKFKARKTPHLSAEDACDDLWVAGFGRLMAGQALGGLVQLVTPGEVTFDQDAQDTNVAEITQRFMVVHRTASNVIT